MMQQAMQRVLVPTYIIISKTERLNNKAIDHRNCDPLTVSVGFLHTAFNIKDNFSKK